MESWKEFKQLKRCTIYVSSYGNVKTVNNNGNIRILSQYNRGGRRNQYLCFGYRDNYSKVLISSHVAVATLFIGDKPGCDYCVDHIDNDPTNNHYKNLRWITLEENGRKADSIYS